MDRIFEYKFYFLIRRDWPHNNYAFVLIGAYLPPPSIKMTFSQIWPGGKSDKSIFRRDLRYCTGRKISYFDLARKLIRRIISPNQDDFSYSIQTSFPGQQKLDKLPNTASLAGQRRQGQTSHWGLLNSSSSMDTWGNLSNLWIPCKEFQLNIN